MMRIDSLHSVQLKAGLLFFLFGESVIINPIIIKRAVNIMTWVIRGLLTREIFWVVSRERNNRIVISPLGAINTSGFNGSFDILSWITLRIMINATMMKAHTKVSVFRISDVSIIKPNNRKKRALTRNVASTVITLSL